MFILVGLGPLSDPSKLVVTTQGCLNIVRSVVAGDHSAPGCAQCTTMCVFVRFLLFCQILFCLNLSWMFLVWLIAFFNSRGLCLFPLGLLLLYQGGHLQISASSYVSKRTLQTCSPCCR